MYRVSFRGVVAKWEHVFNKKYHKSECGYETIGNCFSENLSALPKVY